MPGTNETICSKIFAHVSSLNAVARAAVMNVHQYNEEYGCNISESEGTVIECGQGHARIYKNKDDVALRTKEGVSKYAEQAVASENVVKGVKGPSI